MTMRRMRETRSGMAASFPNGWGFTDPAAIPPPGLFQMQRAGVPVTTHTSLQVDVVFTALRVISNSIIKMGDPRAFQWGYDDFNRPYKVWAANQPKILTNTWGNLFQYDGMSRTVMSLGLFGEAFWYTLTRDYLGFPASIEVLNPAFVELKKDFSGNERIYYGTGAQKVELDPDNLTHIPFMAMPGANRGLSSIEYGGVSFALAMAAMEFGSRFFAQGASPSFVLTAETKLNQEEAERIAQKFLVQHSGLQSSHLPLVLDGGLKAEKISSTPDEAQFIGTLEYARNCIAAWFGLPSHLVGGDGDKGNVWGKTVQEQGFQLVDFTLSGYTVRLNEAFSSLLPRGTNAVLDESVIQRASAADLAAEITAARQFTVLTPNDVRVTKFGAPPLPDGNDLISPAATNVAPTPAAPSPAPTEEPDNG